MNGVILAALTGGPAAVAAGVGLLRLSARLTVVQWNGPADHPRHAPKLSDGTCPPEAAATALLTSQFAVCSDRKRRTAHRRQAIRRPAAPSRRHLP